MRAVSRAVGILRAFTPERQHLALAEVARAAGLDSGTTRRILVTLKDEGLVRQDDGNGTYCLSLELLQLASAVPDGNSLRELTASRLMRLARETQATVFLSIRQGDAAVCLARYHSESAVQVRWWSVGGKLPLNCGAGPKVLLSNLSGEEKEQILSGSLTQLTGHSTAEPESLRTEIDQISQAGWALTQDDVAEGLSALAVPLCNGLGEVLAAISIGGLTPQIISQSEPRWLNELQRCEQDLAPIVRSISPVDVRLNDFN